MKFLGGMLFGMALSMGTFTLMAESLHPRIAAAIEHLRDARSYMMHQHHDFGGHRDAAIRATDSAIREMEICARYHK